MSLNPSTSIRTTSSLPPDKSAAKQRKASSLSTPKDSVHFGSDSVRTETGAHATFTDEKPKLTDALWAGVKSAFSPKGMLKDLGYGLVATLVLAVIPPHLHALAVLPSWMILGGVFRGIHAGAEAYSNHS